MFDHFYSIIRPHKAAAFITVKRAKLTIVCIILFSILFNIPLLYTITNQGKQCVPDQTTTGKSFYFWLSYMVQFVIPFALLLTMNCSIIHTIRTRSILKDLRSKDQGQGQTVKTKTSEVQIYCMLLLVAFSFFILIIHCMLLLCTANL